MQDVLAQYKYKKVDNCIMLLLLMFFKDVMYFL